MSYRERLLGLEMLPLAYDKEILLDFSTVRRQFCTIRFFYNYTFLLLQLDFTFCIYFKSLYFPRVGTPHGYECPVRAHPFWAFNSLCLYVFNLFFFYILFFDLILPDKA